MGRLIRFLFQIFFLALTVIVLTVVWICFDGLNDVNGKTDAALAIVDPANPNAVLDRAAKLYHDEEFTKIIVTGTGSHLDMKQLEGLRDYLVKKGVPESTILMEENGDGSIPAIAHNTADKMNEYELKSLTLIEDYVTITRTKLALYHNNVAHTHKSHIGELSKQDSLALAEEVYAVYDYIGRTWVVPGMSELKKEAGVAADKAKEDAHAAKKSVDHSIDNLPK